MSIGTVALLVLAGAAGTLCRFGVGHLVGPPAVGGFPYATFAVNLAGCLLFGVVWVLAEQGGPMSTETRLILLAGFAGAFTTFSTLAFDAVHLFRGGFAGMALLYLFLSNTLGLGLLYGGMRLGRLMIAADA